MAILRESQPTDEERKEVAEDSGIRHEVILDEGLLPVEFTSFPVIRDEGLLDKPGC